LRANGAFSAPLRYNAGMTDDYELPIRPDDTWTLMVGGVHRHAKVVASAAPGWWRCIDLETGIAFTASERWFVDRLPEAAEK
jgi:hypothetical protein